MERIIPYGMLSIFLLTVILLALLRPLAFRIGLLDHPGARKQHQGTVPLVGGIGMSLSFVVGCLWFGYVGEELTGLLLGILLVVVVGVWDDFRELSSGIRFIAQIAAASAMIGFGDVVLRDLGHISFSRELLTLGALAIPLTIFSSLGVINALNMMDGVDGLAGLIALNSVVAIGLLAHLGGEPQWVGLTFLLLLTILGFLLFNWRHSGDRKALMFMGDAGSMFLGFVICWLVVRLSQGDERLFSPVTALWIFAVPLIDTVTMMIRRLLKGRSPFEADREHFHHMLLSAGFSARKTVMILAGLAFVCAAFGVWGELYGIAENWMFALFMTLFCAHFWTVRHAWKVKRFLNRTLMTSS